MDTDVILLRTINVRTPLNAYVTPNTVLTSVGGGATAWVSISSIFNPGYNFFSTLSTNAGYASFVSTIPSGHWSSIVTSNLPVSTVEQWPNYTTGDIYFSTVSFSMAPFLQYIKQDSTTKMILEVNPQYLFPRLFLGTQAPYTLLKEFSTFVQYETVNSGRQILATYGDMLTSQMSNIYTSNVYNTQVKLALDTPTVIRNAMNDGPTGGYYTVYHRIPGGMANLVPDPSCGCGTTIGTRGGFSNENGITVNNNTQLLNGVFLHVYNQGSLQ